MTDTQEPGSGKLGLALSHFKFQWLLKTGSTGAEVSNEKRRPVIVRPFYGDGHSHEYGATQADVEEGQDQVLERLKL